MQQNEIIKVINVSVQKQKDFTLLHMPGSYRKHIPPQERHVIRSDLIQVKEEIEDKVEANRSKRFRLKIDDTKDGQEYQSELFTKEPQYQKPTVLLFKSRDTYTIVFADQKLECTKYESKEYIDKKMEFMDKILDARRKKQDLEKVVQEKSKTIQNLPNVKMSQIDGSDDDSVYKKNKKKLKKQKKFQHLLAQSDDDSQQQSKKKIKKNDGSDFSISEESVEQELSQDLFKN